MQYENQYPGIDRYAVWMVRRKAAQLSRQAGFIPGDRKDLEQELMIHLVTSLPRFSPERGKFSTFVDCVLESKAATLIEANTAPVRDRRRCTCSLDEPLEISVGDRGDLLQVDHENMRSPWDGAAPASRKLAQAARLDVARVIERLTPQQQAICNALKDGTPSQAIRELKIPRKRFYREMKLLRALFTQAGLGEYV